MEEGRQKGKVGEIEGKKEWSSQKEGRRDRKIKKKNEE